MNADVQGVAQKVEHTCCFARIKQLDSFGKLASITAVKGEGSLPTSMTHCVSLECCTKTHIDDS